MQEQNQNQQPVEGEKELGYLAAMVNDFIATLPPSTRETVAANAGAAIQNLGKLLKANASAPDSLAEQE